MGPEEGRGQRFIVGGYNNGPFGMLEMIRQFAKKHPGEKPVWKKIADDTSIQVSNKRETVSYVESFLKRLGRL